jgi:colicin import membrane protein
MSDFVDPLKEPLAYDRDKRSATDQFAEDWYERALDAEREQDAERETARAEKKAAAEKAAAEKAAAEKAAADEDDGAQTP